MWNRRSAGHSVVPALVYLITTLVACSADAQTATDAITSKQVKVLQIQEASGTKESSVKKAKSGATHAKKKVAKQPTVRPTVAEANEGEPAPNPNARIQSAMAVVAPTPPAAQSDTLTPSAEQTGTLAVGDRAVAVASSLGEDENVDLSMANSAGTRENSPTSAPVLENSPAANIQQTPGTQIAQQRMALSSTSPLSQALATLSGAVVAAALGWYLIRSRRKHAFG
jgi:hypothetical protein